MKYCYTFVVFVVLLSSGSLSVSAQTIDFPDANLAAEVRNRLGLDATDPITQTNILNLTTVAPAHTAGITDLTGLEYATNLSYLSFGSHGSTAHNAVSDLSPLSGLTNLQTLDFTQNAVSDISALKNLINLTSLQFGNHGGNILGKHNAVSDISALSNMTELTYLDFENNNVSDISALRNLTKLQTLRFSYNDVSNLSPLSGLTSLTTLEAAWNADPEDRWERPSPHAAGLVGNLRNISALSGLNSLTTLTLSSNSISDVEPLRGLTNLQILRLGDNKIVSIEPLQGLTALTLLYLQYNEISNLEPLQGLTNLTVLYMWFNKISDVEPLRGLTNLQQLGLQCNSISDVEPLRGLTELSYLGLSGGNSISDVEPLSGLTKLRTLVLDHTVDEDEVANTLSGLIESGLTVRFQELNCSVSQPAAGGGSSGGGSGLSSPGQISFSELMFASEGGPDSLPQWIELYNASETETANMRGWRLEIEWRDENGEHQSGVITLKNLIVPPQQVALIVAGDAPNTVDIPEKHIYNFFQHHPRVFKQPLPQQQSSLLGQSGFCVRLSDPSRQVKDIVGNLDGDRYTADAPIWELPAGRTDDGFRTSLLRRYDPETDKPLDGTVLESYWRAAAVELEIMSYWGRETDIGNPGYRDQGRLPFVPPLISFSELMVTSRGGLHSLPQWMELYNASETETVNLQGWELKIEGRDANGEHRLGVVTFDELLIPPKQTALIVTWRGQHSLYIPRDRVYYLYAQDVFKQRQYQIRNRVLGEAGFFLKLSDPDGIVRDIVGNLDGKKTTTDKPKWELPFGETGRGFRTSLLRRYYRATDTPLDGKKPANWVRAADVALETVTYWGKKTDIGSPGYTNAERLPPGQISFSELMLTSKGGLHSLPQWIELYNASKTETVNLRGWTLEIESRDASGEHRSGMVTLEDLLVPPEQTALIVTWTGRHSREIPKDRIHYLFHDAAFAQKGPQSRNKVLGQTGFFLKVSDPKGVISDVVGNLDGDRQTADMPVWELPAGKIGEGFRTSLLRRYHVVGMPLDGTLPTNWMRAADEALGTVTYWGKETDIGNPGYTNEDRLLPEKQVSFSELMLTSKGGLHSLPQWIELYNASETEDVNLKGWKLKIESRDGHGEHRSGMVTFDDLRIAANQTALIVTWRGQHCGSIPKDRVYYVYAHDVFTRDGYQIRNQLLGREGFFLALSDTDGVVRDVVGNLDGDKTTADTPNWKLLSEETDKDFRTSLMRRYYHVTGVPLDGKSSSNWVPASNLPLTVKTYWGKETDIGNPGYRGGGPLPVTLSRFRPERTETGHVIIKWTTASEKDNAGFNILRGQQRQGRFVRLNPKLIPGAGTTSERHDYTWTDTTANPQIVYYYRLEDVSFSGKQRQLATVRLRGHVSASGKLTTRWGDLKQKK